MVFSKTEIFWILINSLNQRYGFINCRSSENAKIAENALNCSDCTRTKSWRSLSHVVGGALKPIAVYWNGPTLSYFFRPPAGWYVSRHCAPPKDGQRRVTGGGVQDSRSMKPRIRNAHLLITHVLDSCVKLLTVLHTSSTQGQSVDFTSAGYSKREDFLTLPPDDQRLSHHKVGIKTKSSCIFIS